MGCVGYSTSGLRKVTIIGVINFSSSMTGELQMAAFTLVDEGCIIQHSFFFTKKFRMSEEKDQK